MIAPWRVSTPAKGVPVGNEGMTPLLVVLSSTGAGGGASVTWADCAATRGTRPKTIDLANMVDVRFEKLTRRVL